MLLEDLAWGAIAEAAARRVVEPVSEAAEVGVGERLGLDLARQVAAEPESSPICTRPSGGVS